MKSTVRGVSWRIVLVMTLGMGSAVAISWFVFFRSLESYGLEPATLVQPGRLAVYVTQAVLVGAFLFALGRWWLRGTSSLALATMVTAAWLLEGIVLTVIGDPLVANELDPEIAWYYWLAATAGPLQPMAAFAAGWLGIRHAPRAPSPIEAPPTIRYTQTRPATHHAPAEFVGRLSRW